jgi:phosphoribosylanthranilate isomerase
MRLKVCGMKYQDNIEQVAALQPDYLGFIFHEKSLRYLGENQIPNLPDTIKKTGVFVDAELEEVINKVNQYLLHAVQLHGEESPEYCEDLKRFCHFENKTNLKQIPAYAGITEIIKAFSIDKDFDFDSLKPYEAVLLFIRHQRKITRRQRHYVRLDHFKELHSHQTVLFKWRYRIE